MELKWIVSDFGMEEEKLEEIAIVGGEVLTGWGCGPCV